MGHYVCGSIVPTQGALPGLCCPPPGARLPESVNAGPNIGYVIEGTFALQVGDAVQRIEAGKAFEWPLTGRRLGGADGAQPVRLVLFDARP